MQLPRLIGLRVKLRTLKKSDKAALVENANDPEIARFIPSIPYPYTNDDARRWVNKAQRLSRYDSAYHFGIERREDKELIGVIGLKNVNPVDSNAEIEYWLGKRYQRKGYALEAAGMLLDFAFKTLRLHRTYAIVIDNNKKSISLLEKLGFIREGVWRQGCKMNRRWHDVYAYGLMHREYLSQPK